MGIALGIFYVITKSVLNFHGKITNVLFSFLNIIFNISCTTILWSDLQISEYLKSQPRPLFLTLHSKMLSHINVTLCYAKKRDCVAKNMGSCLLITICIVVQTYFLHIHAYSLCYNISFLVSPFIMHYMHTVVIYLLAWSVIVFLLLR